VPLPTYAFQRERYWMDIAPAEERDGAESLGIVSKYYDAFTNITVGQNDASANGVYLTFGPFPEIVPGFSWLLTMLNPEAHEEHVRVVLKAQQELRAVLFRHVDFSSCKNVLDFGCGYATDLIVLAKKYPHLKLHGYTISAEQANLGGQRVRESHLGDRIGIYHRDSAKNLFPDVYDLIFGFEVAHHIRNKHGLFSNIGEHLRDGGLLVMADFVSNTFFQIEHEQSSSFFLMKNQWIDVLSQNRLRVVDCVDVSPQIANFLHTQSFDTEFELLARRSSDKNVQVALKSYDQLGKLLRRGLATYVLMTARREEGLVAEELQRLNRQAFDEMVPYAVFDGRGARRTEEDDWFLELDWEPAAVPAPRVAAGRFLLLGAGSGLGAALRFSLAAAGHTVVEAVVGVPDAVPKGCMAVNDTSAAGVQALLADAFGGQAPTAVVHLRSLEGSGELDEDALEAALVRGCDSVVYTVQALAGMRWRDAPRLWLVTRGAQAVDAGDVSVAQAPLLGLGRVIALEHAELCCVRVDLDPARPEREVDAVLAELLADDAEDEVALREVGRRVARLIHRQPEAERREKVEPAGNRPFRLSIDAPGVLDHLVLRATERRAPGPGEVQIAVEAAGLNFLDAMKAMGIYPGMGDGPVALGGECAGRIVAVGEGVQRLRIGQEVVAVAPFSFGTHVTVDARMVAPRPATLTAAQAAALPVGFMTDWYGLVHLGRLRAGERVLIHSATGGTGLAAVQIAHHLGAEVFATAGTEEKRAWLRAHGIAHVMDSRSLDFAEQVLSATDGEGVDVVFNSLSGAAVEASLSTLAPDGRFIELGKTDIYADRPLCLAHFKKSLSYSAVDLAGLGERRPARFAALLAEVVDLFAQGVLEPPPVETFPVSRAVDAFRKMAQAKHLGKLVLTLEDPEVCIRVPAQSRAAIRADGSYFVTGGLGGLGLRVARWLAEQGAGHLVLVGRSGAASPAQQAAVAALEESGARVTVAKADVADRAQLEQVLCEVAASGIPLRGVVHAAGLLDDGMLLQQSPARFRAVMAPKVQGALHLDALTRETPLDFFVLYASGAGLFGSPGQGNYAAANTFLDALAHHRRAEGLPALSIDWGLFAEVGLAAAQENRGERLVSRGMRSLTVDEGLSALGRLLDSDRGQVGVVPLNLRQWVGFNQAAASSRRLSRLVAAQRAGAGRPAGDRDLLERLAAVEPDGRAALLEEVLRIQVSQVLRLPEDKLDVDVPLSSLGMDSLMSLELRNRIEAVLGIAAPATLLWTYPTVAGLCAHLAGEPREAASAESPQTTSDSAVEIEDMSEDELKRLIATEFEVLS
jgi:epothilone polyketide synthase D